LGSLPSQDFIKHLKQLIAFISLEEAGWTRAEQDTLKESVILACSRSMERKQEILHLLYDFVVHPANYVRHCTVQILDALISILNSEEVSKNLLPALSTLGGDHDFAIRSSSIQAFGNVARANLEDSGILDTIGHQMISFLEDEKNRIPVIKVLTTLVPTVPASFRDKYILPNLLKVSEKEHFQETKSTEHKKVNQLLFESFRAFNGCVIDEDAIINYILPGLQNIQSDADQSYKPMLDSMVFDMQNAVKHEEIKPKHEESNIMGKAFFSKVSQGWAMPSMSMPGIPGRKKE